MHGTSTSVRSTWRILPHQSASGVRISIMMFCTTRLVGTHGLPPWFSCLNIVSSFSRFSVFYFDIFPADEIDGLDGLHVQMRLIPTLPCSSPIPMHRLSPSHSNLRVNASSENTSTYPSSPLYNTCLALSFTPKPHLLSAHTLQQLCPAYGDALTLLRVWANQRGYSSYPSSKPSIRGFDRKGTLWTAILEALILGEEGGPGKHGGNPSRKPVGKGLSSYQLFKAALNWIGD